MLTLRFGDNSGGAATAHAWEPLSPRKTNMRVVTQVIPQAAHPGISLVFGFERRARADITAGAD
jgi:hypothetical protein